MNEIKPVLLVEDNPGDEKLALLAIKNMNIGRPVDVARDGVEALDYLFGEERKKNPQKPYPILVLMDMKLPKVDGLEVLSRMKKNEATKMIPVIMFTTSKDERDIRNSYMEGANSYIPKPLEYDDFNHVLEMAITYWLEYNQYPI